MNKRKEKKNWLEWLVTIISTVLVLFTLGFLVYQLITEEKTPPNIQITLGEITKKDHAFAVPVQAKNTGTQTAENVVIEIVFSQTSTVEKAQLTFQYLPGKSTATGWASFSTRPKKTNLKARVTAYGIP